MTNLDQRNIVLILNDDHAQWASGAYGNQELVTPSIDYLAQTGAQMQNSFTPTPVCSPARACLLTGHLASQHGIHDYLGSDEVSEVQDWLRDEVLLSEILARHGYQNAYTGKWHLGKDEIPQRGFDYWFTLNGDYPINHGGPHRYSDQGDVRTIVGYKTSIITEHAIRFLRQRDQSKPFFLVVGYTSTHSPWVDHPERLVQMYRDASFADVPLGEDYPFGVQALESTFETRLNPKQALAEYYAAVTQLDEGVGDLIDELEALRLRDNTLFVYTSDHGLNCGHHGIWGKGNGTLPLNLVEESIRIPLILNHPHRIMSHQRRDEFVDHLDLFQTLLEYAGAELPSERVESYAGRSFWPQLSQAAPASDWRAEQFCEYGDVRMARNHQYKLIQRDGVDEDQFFDLENDPREMVNHIATPRYQDEIARLSRRLQDYFARYESPIYSGRRVRDLPRHNLSEAWRS